MLFYILRPILTLWLYLFYPIRIHGKEKLIQDGNTVVICNHLCKTDIFYVGNLFKGKTYYLAKKEWFDNKILGWFIRKLGGIPVDREHSDIQSVKTSLRVLKDGKRLCIFPEGTRNRTGTTEIQPIHAGAAMIAFKTGAKVIPLNIHAPAKFMHKNDIYVGEPFDFSEFAGQKLDAELNRKMSDIMFEKLKEAREEHENFLKAREEAKRAKKSKNKTKKG